jgi:hypothetical protein
MIPWAMMSGGNEPTQNGDLAALGVGPFLMFKWTIPDSQHGARALGLPGFNLHNDARQWRVWWRSSANQFSVEFSKRWKPW